MENTIKKNATRGKERSPSSRMVTIASYLLLATGLTLFAGCATAGKGRVEPANSGIDTRLDKLAKFVPARYDKPDVSGERAASPFENERPALPAAPVVKREAPAADPSSAVTVEQGGDAARAAEGNEHGTNTTNRAILLE